MHSFLEKTSTHIDIHNVGNNLVFLSFALLNKPIINHIILEIYLNYRNNKRVKIWSIGLRQVYVSVD